MGHFEYYIHDHKCLQNKPYKKETARTFRDEDGRADEPNT